MNQNTSVPDGILSIPFKIVTLAKGVVGIATFLAVALIFVSIFGIINGRNSIIDTDKTGAVAEFAIAAHQITAEYDRLIASEGKTGIESLNRLKKFDEEIKNAHKKLTSLLDSKDPLVKKSDEVLSIFSMIDELGKKMVVAFLDDDKKSSSAMSKEYSALVDKLDALEDEIILDIHKQVYARNQLIYKILSIITIIAFLVFILFVVMTSLSVKRLLSTVIGLIKKEKSDQIELQKKLTLLSDDLERAGSGLTDTSSKLLSSGDSLKMATEESRASVKSSENSLENVSKRVQETASYTSFSVGQANTAQQKVTEGMNAILEMSRAMNQIKDSNQSLGSIIEMIEKIEEKTKFIDDIVLQTELLSLNARIEAAHAGLHGRGFSIVAQEVGGLARKSGESAKEIDAILSESVTKISESINEISQKISLGESRTQDCVKIFESIAEMNTKLKTNIETIEHSTSEQVSAISAISASINQIQGATEKSVESANETIDQSNFVNSEAEKLGASIKTLEELVKSRTKSDGEIDYDAFMNSLHLMRFALLVEKIISKA